MRGVSGPSTQMDIQGWRKWLRTPGPIRAQQKKEAGMLKLLLGHWKAHRKKPSLLPEDGDVHFEDPTRINPIFEDSDSSISSSRRVTDSLIEENQTVSRVENEQTQNETDESVINELIDVSVPTHSKELVISDSADPEDETTDAKNDKNSSITKVISQSDSSVIKEPSVKLDPNVEDVSVSPLEPKPEKVTTTTSLELTPTSHDDNIDNITSKSDKNSIEVKSEEKMRLYNQPSTSAIRENKNSFHDTAVKDLTKPPISKSSDLQNNNSIINEPSSKQNKPDKLENIVHSSSPLRPNRQNSPPSLQSVQPDKPAKLRAKAIQELIKKFQGPSSESENVTDEVTKVDSTEAAVESKHLSNKSPEAEIVSNKYLKRKDENPSSPSIQLNESVNKITKVEKEPLSKPKKTSLETVSPIKNDQKVEALSNIFKFPPPPPLEPLPNESNLHGKILKERKFNSQLTTSNKRQENIEKLEETVTGKTRSDSSLDRTKTASSNKSKEGNEKSEKDSKKETPNKIQETVLEEKIKRASIDRKSSDSPLKKNIKVTENTKVIPTEVKNTKQDKSSISKIQSSEEKFGEKSNPESKKPESEPHSSNNSASGKKESPVPTPKASSSFLHKHHSSSPETNAVKSTAHKQKSSLSKASLKQHPLNEKENIKSHSEDSGITRGDQISSETTQETTPLDNLPEEQNSAQNPSRKTKKEKKLKPGNKKPCKHCRHAPLHNGSIGRSQYDEYYDGLTGIRHFYKGKHSDSWTSDLSWEEKELLRRLRNKKGTVRSNTPSTKSRHSRHRFIDERQFRRHHNYRRSISDDSTFYGSSLCSCDECWAQYIRDYSYVRASVRGMSPIQEVCTCHTAPQSFLGRRVQFRSDTIQEASQSKRTSRASTPAPPAQSKEEDEADDKSSQMSSKTKEEDSVQTDPELNKEKKSKNSEEAYRFLTPWELEEWNLLMRKQLLQKRRRRARCMGLMALAMVVFIGLVVTILMVYLRRKVI